MSNTTPKQSRSPLLPGAIYPLGEFRRLTGLGAHALRTARKKGLKVYRCGGRGFVFADDFSRFLRESSVDTEPGGNGAANSAFN